MLGEIFAEACWGLFEFALEFLFEMIGEDLCGALAEVWERRRGGD